MSKFVLMHRDNVIFIDSHDLDPGELQALKHLGKQPHFSFERVGPQERIPPMDHDALDDIALEIVGNSKGGYFGHDHLRQQAYDRVKQRGLQR